MRIKIKKATLKSIYLHIAIVSMVVNSFSPFVLASQYVYAEGTDGVVEEEAPAAEEPSASDESSSDESSTSGEEAANEEESSSTEEPAAPEEPTEPMDETASSETEIVESAVESTTDETQQGDILPDGASDYRPEATSEPSGEQITDTSDLTDPIVEALETIDTAGVVEQSSEESDGEIEKEYLADGAEIIDSTDSDWELNEENGYYETKENVKLGVKYIFPDEEKVTVTFSALPKNEDDRSKLRIQQVEIDDLNLPDEVSTSAEFAYDITTEMEDGSFEYGVTLPKPEGVEAGVSYIEGSVSDVLDKEITEEDINTVGAEDIDQDADETELAVKDLDHFTIFIVTGSVGPIIDLNASPDNAMYYLRYVGNPAPENYSHAYQWGSPFYVCDPNDSEVTFTGTIDVDSMSIGGVAFVGLLDKGLLESGKTGYQSGAYAYIFKTSGTNVRIAPTDGNLNDEIVQVFKDYTIPGDGELDLVITIYNGDVSVQVEGDSPIVDTYGTVKTINNGSAYAWNEFEFGAIPGWDNYESTDMPYSFDLSGCEEISTDKVKICHSTDSDSNPYIVNNPNKSGDLSGHVDHIGGVYPADPWGDIIPPFTYFECPTDLSMYTSDDNTKACWEQIGTGKDKEKKYADKVELNFSGMNWDTTGQAIYDNDCEIPEPAACGNGVLETNEQCDDGNITAGDGCSATCEIETPPVRCGDGNVNQRAEDCDDGNQNNDDYCTNECTYNSVCLTDGTNMIVNGGFESPVVAASQKWDIYNAYSPMLGWAVDWYNVPATYGSQSRPDNANLELHRGVNGWTPFAGSQYAELDSDWYGPTDPVNNEPATVQIAQTIPTLEGYKYKVNFAHSPRPNTTGANNVLEFSWDNSTVDTYSAAGGGNTTWTSEEYEFVADADGTTDVSFIEKGTADSLGSFLDGVSVTCEGPEVKPVCGDLVKNQEIEECDGTDGVTKGENFCTASCELVPIYNGGSTCPAGTTEKLIGSYSIGSQDTDGETLSLTSGNNYLFKATGTFIPTGAPGYVSDAGHTLINGSLSTQYGIYGIGNDFAAHALLGNLGGGVGVINWGAYNASHEYSFYGPITTNSPQFLIGDRYDSWFNTPYNIQSGMNDNSGSLNLDVYECAPLEEVTVCKENTQGQTLSGWEVALADAEKVAGPTSIGVTDGDGTDSPDLPAGKYLIKVTGTYRYGGTEMIADAGFSFRPLNIPDGTGGWVSGFDLSSGSNGLMAWINDTAVNWGALDTSGHAYTYLYDHAGGPINLSIYDNQYADNVNNGNFQFEIYKIDDGGFGTTGKNGCVTLSVPQGDYILDELLKDGWVDVSGKGELVQVDSETETFTLVNKYDSPVTIVATKIVCEDETELPNWGYGAPNNITSNTAQRWLNIHPNCHLEKDWQFQWGDDSDTNPGDATIGEVAGWTTFGPTGDDGTAVATINDFGKTSQIKVREVLKDDYIPFTFTTNGNNSNTVSAELYCSNDVLNYDNDDRITNPQYGETYYCVAWNVPETGSIHGYKWNDLNGNGTRDCIEESSEEEQFRVARLCELEPLLPEWRIFIDENDNSQFDEGELNVLTDSSEEHLGWYVFDDLPWGTYRVCEEQQPGWQQTFPIDPICHEVTIPDTNTPTMLNAVDGYAYNFGNYQTPGLTIAKFNNAVGAMNIGDTVQFTIEVTAHGNKVFNVNVTDLFSNGFKYVPGSWAGVPDEPTYASPGTWNIGNMNPGDVATLTYLAEITNTVDPGTYRDLAWADGLNAHEDPVPAEADETGFVAQYYVGTNVLVEGDNPSTPADAEVDEETIEEEEVLGASDIRLPATGSETIILAGALALLLVGAMLIAISKKKKSLVIVGAVLLLSIFGLKPVSAATADLMVRVEEPDSLFGAPFQITFVALDRSSAGPLEAVCEKDGPNDAGWVQFDSMPIIQGGNSGICDVTAAYLNGNGHYLFRVGLYYTGEESETIYSDPVETDYDNDAPDKPKYIEVDRKNSCKYEIEFKTADDGQTDYVEVYMSDEKEYTADAGSRIRTIDIGPNEKYTFTEEVAGEDCNHRQYFSVRAFDSAGNGSDVEAEELTDVKTVTITKEGETTEESILLAAGATGIGGPSGEGAEVVTTEAEIPGEEGSILGEATTAGEDEGAGSQKGFFGKLLSSPWTWVTLVIILGIIVVNGIRKNKQEQ